MGLIAQNLTLKPDHEFHLNNISFEMQEGQLYTILGRTLSGKTTLMKTIAGLITPDSGTLSMAGQDFAEIPVWNRKVAMVYQQFINYPHLKVFDNVAFPLKVRKLPAAKIAQKVAHALEQVGLTGFEDRKIQALSGGQQQRVALARSLVKDARILLLDEPLVNLDYKLREQLREEFRNIFNADVSQSSILIYSSTDPLEAMQLGGSIIVLDEGRVLQQASAQDIFEYPATTRVAEIANDPAMNLMQGTLADGMIVVNETIKIPLPKHLQHLTPGAYVFGVRADRVSPAKDGMGFEVELSEINGSETFLHLKNQDQTLVGLLPWVQDFNLNERVNIAIDAAWLYAFDQSGQLLKSPYDEVE